MGEMKYGSFQSEEFFLTGIFFMLSLRDKKIPIMVGINYRKQYNENNV